MQAASIAAFLPRSRPAGLPGAATARNAMPLQPSGSKGMLGGVAPGTTGQPDDGAQLAEKCRNGDPAAWALLVRTQHRRVYALCYRFTGSGADAEDLTQEVFLKVYRNLGSFDAARGSFQTWLTTMARNLLVDHFRRSRLERASDSMDAGWEGEPDDLPSLSTRLEDSAPGPLAQAVSRQTAAIVQEALTRVSPELREAVILRDIRDMDYKEIAEVLRIPEGTVKSRISRGRAELAKLLERMKGQVM